MNILYDHQIFGWQVYGGISRYIYELANNLNKFEYEHDVRVFSPLFINRYINEKTGALRIIGKRVPRLPRAGRIYRTINDYLAWPYYRLSCPDIIHETYYSPRRLAPRSSKVILTVHDMIHERFPDSFSSFDKTRQQKAIACKNADHIICVSENTRNDLIELLAVPEKKVSVVYHGFNLTETIEDCSAEFVRPYFLYVGNRGGYKNFENLLRAFSRSALLTSDYELICFGGGSFTRAEIETIRKLGLNINQIRQTSGNDGKLAWLYKSARAFVYPSLYEGFGIPPLEAMSYKCPVICSDTSSLPEVVGDAAHLLEPTDVDAIKHAMEKIALDDDYRAKMVTKGLERIKLFSWEKCALQTLQVYQRVLRDI